MEIFDISLCLLIALLWSITPIFHNFLIKKIDYIQIFVLVWVFTSFFMIFFLIYYKNNIFNGFHKITKFEIILTILNGFIAVFATYLYYKVIDNKNNNAYIVSALTYSSPLFTVLIAYFLLKQKITVNTFIGIIFIIMGAFLLSLE